MSKKRYFLRARGKVLGPFSANQLSTLRDRGQLGRFDEISEDRQTWLPASTLTDLFPPVQLTEILSVANTVNTERTQASRPESGWYYTRNGQQQGPCQFDALQREATTGRLVPTDPVWHQSLPNWIPAHQVDGLISSKRPARWQSRNIVIATSAVAVLLATLTIVYLLVLRPILWPVTVTYLSSNAGAPEITEAYRSRVYLVQSPTSTGSGLLFARDQTRGLIVTNHHVLDGDRDKSRVPDLFKMSINAKISSQLDFRSAQVAAIHRHLDIALLLIEMDPDRPSAVAILRKKALRQGEEAVALGNPLGLPFFTSSGVISSTSSAGGYIWTSCPISKGNSGGPLFLKRRGLWVGINTLKLGDIGLGAENLNAAIPAEEVLLSLQGPQQEAWTWNESHKDRVVALGKLVPLEE